MHCTISSLIGAPLLAEPLLKAATRHLSSADRLSDLHDRLVGMPSPTIDAVVRSAAELTTEAEPGWEYVAAVIRLYHLERSITAWEREQNITSYPAKIHRLTAMGLLSRRLIDMYDDEELADMSARTSGVDMEPLTLSAVDMLAARYLIRDFEGRVLERPRELMLGLALYLAIPEPHEGRLAQAERFYAMLSRMEVTMATPTLANARKPHGQLSSCFIDTVPDDLSGIYRTLDNFAQVSKHGGGMGVYLGHVRARGSDIQGFKGAAGGVLRWVRLVNDTAVAVDQLGVRSGAVACYLDIWHPDLPEFLQIRTNNGDNRLKAHDVFPAVCVPNYFWELCRQEMNAPWHLMCPHEIRRHMGYSLADFCGDDWKTRYLACVSNPRIPRRTMAVKDIVRLILRAVVETGSPFIFNRDLVNAANPNAHQGMIYCSNLCTEIAQNTKAIESGETTITCTASGPLVTTTTHPGDFVVCNLASLVLGRLHVEDDELLGRVVETAVRALDNVIDLNLYPTPYARLTADKYRAIGLGVSGWHHALAVRGLAWESEEHIRFTDHIFERINYHAIRASCQLAQERGPYSCFEGSDWHTGAYFVKRGYTSAEWAELRTLVARHGLRNGYLLAVAPTVSTSVIAGTTAGIDPVFKRFFIEEKKTGMLLRVAPELNRRTKWLYKAAHHIEQEWSIRAGAARQRHVDQAVSMNLYITNDFSLRQLLELYLLAWEQGIKTIYYVRSKSLEVVEECEDCAG